MEGRTASPFATDESEIGREKNEVENQSFPFSYNPL